MLADSGTESGVLTDASAVFIFGGLLRAPDTDPHFDLMPLRTPAKKSPLSTGEERYSSSPADNEEAERDLGSAAGRSVSLSAIINHCWQMERSVKTSLENVAQQTNIM